VKDRRPRALPSGSSPGEPPPDPAPSPAPRPPVARPAATTSTLAWARAHPVLAVAVVAFLVVAVGGGLLLLPRTEKPRPARGVTTAPPPASGERSSALDTPAPASSPDSAAEGEEVHASPVAASARGLALTYSYRVLPPGGESRYGWTVWLAGSRPVRDGVDLVTYEMDPPAKNGGQFESRNRAADGFPLFGHGPGGWFGVSATVRYRDGAIETLSRRIELPDPE
jgi:hypothetical protein